MINPFIIKKYAAFIIASMFTTISFAVGLIFYNMLVGIGTMFAGLLVGVLIANLLLKNPFTNMLEGKGILGITLDSTGILRFFNLNVNPPYMKGKIGKQQVNDVFDREAVFNLEPPGKNEGQVKYEKDGKTHIILDNDTSNKARFSSLHYPCVIWNSQINSVLTKDFFSTQEKVVFAQHQVLYLNRTMERLSTDIRDFGRGVVESLKPKDRKLGGKWVMYIVIGFLILLLALFAPYVWQTIQGAMSNGVGKGVSTAIGAAKTINPIGG